MCTYVRTYTQSVCVCDPRTCRRTRGRLAREGTAEAQFCSVNPWRRAKGVYHSASEFVVPRLVTSTSIFRTQPRARARFYLSPSLALLRSNPLLLPPYLRVRAAIYLHNIRGGHGGCVFHVCIQGRVPETPAQSRGDRA